MVRMAAKAPARKRDDAALKTDRPGSPERFKGIPRSPGKFRERELARAVRAARRAGGVARVKLMPDGSIDLVLIEQAPQQDAPETILAQL
jgi:hypothetical protein